MFLLERFLRLFFHLLYEPMAWSYDLVADLVSISRWKNWIGTVVPFIEGSRVLELGHGPGHLQCSLLERRLFVVGIDASRQMGEQARKGVAHRCRMNPMLVRSRAQQLPFHAKTFDTVVTTFPAEYIFDPRTLAEVHLVLQPGGKFVMLPVAWITGRGFMDKIMAWTFRITGQTPAEPVEQVRVKLKQLLEPTGFQVEVQKVDLEGSSVLIVLAKKGE